MWRKSSQLLPLFLTQCNRSDAELIGQILAHRSGHTFEELCLGVYPNELILKEDFLSLSLAPWHCWVHWPFISLGWQVWDEVDGVALLCASMSDSLHPACVGMRTRPPHGSLPFIRALHWGLGHSRHRNTTCIASFWHLILLRTTKTVRWLTQGRVCKLWIPWSNAILMLSCGHPLTVPHFFIRKHTAQRVTILFLRPLVRQALMVVTGACCLLFQVITWKKYRKSEGEVCSCLKKMCPADYRSDRPDGFESLGEPQEQIANPFAIVYRSTGFWAAINTALWTATCAKASSLC